jgi:hypothetical protein
MKLPTIDSLPIRNKTNQQRSGERKGSRSLVLLAAKYPALLAKSVRFGKSYPLRVLRRIALPLLTSQLGCVKWLFKNLVFSLTYECFTAYLLRALRRLST